MLYFLPIEPLESRYTAQMLRWVVQELDELGTPYQVILPRQGDQDIITGQFLDVYGTISWKAQQIDLVSRLFKNGRVQNGDDFLIGDLWFPGLEAIPYMAKLSGIHVGIWGWHYAGCADRTDFVQPVCELGGWLSEAAWLKMSSGIFVGSAYHKDLIEQYFSKTTGPLRIYDIGLAWNYEDVLGSISEIPEPRYRAKHVIFPHRGAPEKNPEAFYHLATELGSRHDDIEFIITSSRRGTPEELGFREGKYWKVLTGVSKQTYYALLSESRVFFSSAYQETFGYALQEAITFNTTPVCPARAAYPDILEGNHMYLYTDEDEAVDMVERYVYNPIGIDPYYSRKYHRSVKVALRFMGYAQ